MSTHAQQLKEGKEKHKKIDITEVFLPYIFCVSGRKSESLDASKRLSNLVRTFSDGAASKNKKGHSTTKKGQHISVASN